MSRKSQSKMRTLNVKKLKKLSRLKMNKPLRRTPKKQNPLQQRTLRSMTSKTQILQPLKVTNPVTSTKHLQLNKMASLNLKLKNSKSKQHNVSYSM